MKLLGGEVLKNSKKNRVLEEAASPCEKEKDKKNKKRQKKDKVSLLDEIKTNKKAFWVYISLNIIVLAIAIRAIFNAQWETVYICMLTSLLFMIPPTVERGCKVELPTALEILAYIFVFSAEILGEIANFYEKVTVWDAILHTISGFMFAAFGFCLIDIFNSKKQNEHNMSPLFFSFVSFCFSMTVGIFWEFIEFSIDNLFSMDMQKDTVVKSIFSVFLDETRSNTVIPVEGIVETVITKQDGSTLFLSGYLDIGLIDTMKDLFVNFVGALVFCIIGYFYVKSRGKGRFAKQFIPKRKAEGSVGKEVPPAVPSEALQENGMQTEVLSEQTESELTE